MRILVVTNLYPRPGRETIATFNRRLFRAMADHHDLEIIAPVSWVDKIREGKVSRRFNGPYQNHDGLTVHHPTYYYLPRIGAHYYGQWYRLSVAPLVRRVVGRFQPDVILSCWAHPDGWAINRLARRLGLPTVVKLHGSDILVITDDRRRRARVIESVREATIVAPVCQLMADRAIELGAAPENVVVAYEGIDLETFRPGSQADSRARLNRPGQDRRVLFVGNFLWSKGVAIVVEAFKILRDQGADLRGEFVGRGPDEGKLRALISSYGLDDRLTIIGSRPHEQLPDWYRSSDVVVLPSYSEGIPNVLREASACGRPYVATRVGGIPEIANPYYSELIAPDSPAELATGIRSILSRSLDPHQIAATASNLTWDQSGRLLSGCCELALERTASRRPS